MNCSPKNIGKSNVKIEKINTVVKNIHIKMIVIAYFNYDSQRSDIEKCTDMYAAYKWLLGRWEWILEDGTPTPTTLLELIICLINEHGVMVEMIEI